MHLPILVGEIELNAAGSDLTIDPDRCIRKIGTGLTIPSAELHDLDFFAGSANKRPPEIPREPARLQLQFGEVPRNRQERALANFRGGRKLGVTGVGGRHRCKQVKVCARVRASCKKIADLFCITNCCQINRITMKIKPPVPTAICIAALILGVPSGTPAKEKKNETINPAASVAPAAKAKALPYRGKIALVDTGTKTFTVGKRTIKVTDQTKITKRDSAATMADITAGENVSGSYWKKDDGSLEAKTVKVGAKGEAAAQKKDDRRAETSPSP